MSSVARSPLRVILGLDPRTPAISVGANGGPPRIKSKGVKPENDEQRQGLESIQ